MLSIQRAALRQTLTFRNVVPWRDAWFGKMQPKIKRVIGQRPFHSSGLMQNSSEASSETLCEASSGDASSPIDYMAIMGKTFGMKNDVSLSAVVGTEALDAAILGDEQVVKKGRRGKGVLKEKIKASVIIKALRKPKAGTKKVLTLEDMHAGRTVVSTAPGKKVRAAPANNSAYNYRDYVEKYALNLCKEVRDLDLTVPEPVLRPNQPVIQDVDAPEPTVDAERVVADGQPALQTSLPSYTEFMAQYTNAIREELHYAVRMNVNKVLKGGKTDLLSGCFRECKVRTRTTRNSTELTVPVNGSQFGQSPELFTNELVLLRSAVSSNPANPEESAKLICGHASLQRVFKNSDEGSKGTGDVAETLLIKMHTEDFHRLTGGVEVVGEGANNVLPEIQWDQITSLTSPSRKTRAMAGSKNKVGFWKHICTGALDPWPKAPKVPTLYGNLNEKQNDIVNRLTSKPGVYYLIGPPGTGKTTTLVEAVKGLAQNIPNWRTLVVAPSNRAMQVDIETFVSSAAQEETLPFATIGSMMEKLPDKLAYLHEDNTVSHMLQPLSDVAADKAKDFATLESKFTAALALSQARINRVLNSPVGDIKPKNVQKAVDMFEDEVTLRSAQDVKDRAGSLVNEVTNAFKSLGSTELTKFLLSKAQVHFSTCISSGNQFSSSMKFDIVVQDEASQCDLPEAMIPVEMFQPKLWVQIGDPKQLGAFSAVHDLKKKGYYDSMLQRAADSGQNDRVFMLTEQYRMHPAIRKWPSDLYYGGKLTEGPTLLTRPSPLSQLPSAVPLSGLPSAFVDIVGSEQRGSAVMELAEVTLVDNQESLGKSFSNDAEAIAIADTVHFMLSHGIPPQSIAVISFYSAQVQSIKDQLNGTGVFVNTVDGSQGDEYDFVLISCVRSDHNVGFLNDSRRLNVAMTRAKHACWVFGNAESLQRSNCDFSDYLDYIRTPARNNTSPPTGLLQWKEINIAIQENKGDTKYASNITYQVEKRRKILEKGVKIGKLEARMAEKKKVAADKEKRAAEKAARAAKKTGRRVVVEVESEDEDEEVLKEVVDEVVPQVSPLTDDSTSTWLTDRMEKLGYSKKMMQTCHEQLVEEQGFVQESLFAELTDAEVTNDFLKEIGITAKGAQVYLLRLHRELRERFFPVRKPVAGKASAPKKAAAAAELALPVRRTVAQEFGEKVKKVAGKSAKSVPTAEMAYPSRQTVKQVFAAVEAERAARLRVGSAVFKTETQRASADEVTHESTDDFDQEDFDGSDGTSHEDSASDDSSTEETFEDEGEDEDELDASEAEDAPQDDTADQAREEKRMRKSLAAANEAAKKKTRETEKLGMSANKANDAPLW